VATLIRLSGPLPSPAAAADYERVLRPIYGFSFGVAQARARAGRPRSHPSEAAWKALTGDSRGTSSRQRLRAASVRTAFPLGIRALNRLLQSDFDSDISEAAIFSAGVEAATELAARLRVDGAHVITGHTHRGGPNEGEATWPLAGGGQLHNTGSWVFASAFHNPGTPPSPYWPGTVTWVEDEAPPRRVQLLLDRSHPEMIELIGRTRSRPSPTTRR
jgi:hypothetical protein